MMRSRVRAWFSAAAVAGALPLLLADCRSPTQITLKIRTDASCVDVGGTTITVGKLGEIETKPEAASTDRCTDGSGRIGTMVVVPSGDNDSEVAVRVVTGIGKSPSACVAPDYKGCIVARRAIRYLPHTPLEMPILMGIDCLDRPCDETETCSNGQCVPATIQCTGDHCEPLTPDGGADADAGTPPDATIDQSIDADGGAAGQGGSAGTAGAGGSAGVDGSTIQCTPGTGNCDGNESNGCETDLTTDKLNCGACTHDCLGGGCTAGKCQPVTVFGGSTPTRIALDETHLYFVDYNNGGVFRVAKSGGTAMTLATGQKSVRIAVDATHVYWTNEIGSQILRVPKTGGTTQVVTAAANTPYSFALSDTDVYYTELRANGSVAFVPKAGGAQPAVLSTGENWPFEVTLTATHMYWTNYANNAAVRRVPLAGGTPSTVLSGVSNPYALANDGALLFIAVFGTGGTKGQIVSVPLAGGSETVLASGQAGPRAIAVDASHVYWTNGGNGTVMRTAKDGSAAAPSVIASGGMQPIGLAIDSLAVYWADDKLGLIQKVAK